MAPIGSLTTNAPSRRAQPALERAVGVLDRRRDAVVGDHRVERAAVVDPRRRRDDQLVGRTSRVKVAATPSIVTLGDGQAAEVERELRQVLRGLQRDVGARRHRVRHGVVVDRQVVVLRVIAAVAQVREQRVAQAAGARRVRRARRRAQQQADHYTADGGPPTHSAQGSRTGSPHDLAMRPGVRAPRGLRGRGAEREGDGLGVGAGAQRVVGADVLLERDRHRVIGDRAGPRRLAERRSAAARAG